MIRILLALLCVTSLYATETQLSQWKIEPATPLPPVMFEDSATKTADLLDQVKLDLNEIGLFDLNRKPINLATLEFHSEAGRAYGLAATSLTADRWMKATVEITGGRPLVVYANGKELAKSTSADSGKFVAKSEITLDRTRTDLLVATVSQKSDSGSWTISGVVKQDSTEKGVISTGANLLRKPAQFAYDADLEDLGGLTLSPDGKLLLFKRTIREGEDHKSTSWYELWDVDQAKVVKAFKQSKLSDFQFSKDGKSLYYRAATDDGVELWAFRIASRAEERLQPAVNGLEGYHVLEGERQIVFSASEDAPEHKESYELFRDLEDRRWDRNTRRELFVFDHEKGVTRQLSKKGEFELHKWSVSPSEAKVLLVRNLPKQGRPYVTQEFWTCNLTSGQTEKVLTRSTIEDPQNICWISDDLIAYNAGSHDASPEDTVYHNAEQLVVFTLNLKTGKHKNLTGNQQFSVSDEGGESKIFLNPRDKQLYVHVILGGGAHFAKLSLDGKSAVYRPYKSNFDFTDVASYAADGSRVAYIAADYNSPKAIYVNGAGGEKRLFDPNAKITSDWEMGSMEPWNFTNRLGLEIDGWVYKPADFSADKKYPLIVYYYAGVSPRDVRFSQTYQMWLANGYVVYVLNPVGCFGKGQAFADYHAGDWGTEATQDVIEGTQKFIAAHSFVDEKNMGCYGGSYGGFITLDLVTKTNMFKTAIDMYGISNITNYFGAGTWGYWYCDVASPGQFPWNNKDLYVNKSPMYNADKIKTPLLILHGGADNNVPWLESDQMFVALKLLGQEAVYARFKDETHNINTKYSNLLEHRQMMLEWFDKYLKDQPGAWEERMKGWEK